MQNESICCRLGQGVGIKVLSWHLKHSVYALRLKRSRITVLSRTGVVSSIPLKSKSCGLRRGSHSNKQRAVNTTKPDDDGGGGGVDEAGDPAYLRAADVREERGAGEERTLQASMTTCVPPTLTF